MSGDSPAMKSDRLKYELPRLPLIGFGIDLLLGRPRSFVRDSRTVLAANPYPRRVEGLEHVPDVGPFVVLMNHYSRDGLHPYHCAMVVSAAVAERRRASLEIRWAMTSEWYGRRLGPIPIPSALYRIVFQRVARMYGLVVMPRRTSRAMGRAAALKRLARLMAEEPIGITPEARGSGRLVEPLEGSGLFLQSLSEQGVPLVAVAAWEEGDLLTVRFGPPFSLSVPKRGRREARDRLAREQVMVAIGRLLPREYWGAYAEAIERSLREDPGGAGPR